MQPPFEYLAERRLLTRKLSFWRVAAVLAAIAAVAVGGWRLSGGNAAHLAPHIARITIEGVIVDDKPMLKLIRDVAASHATGVILSINSPGGTTTGAEGLYEELRRLAAKKPTAAVVDGMAASGAYIAALGADEIVARGNSMVGSIGVLMQMPNVSRLLDTVGVKMEEVKSSPLKAAPNGYEPTSPEARAAMAALVNDAYDWFKALVRDRRKLNDAELAAVVDGRVFSGRQSVGLKLIDKVGDEKDAIAWLEEHGVAKGLAVRDWKKPAKLDRFGLLGAAASAAGFPRLASLIGAVDDSAQIRQLDGLVAVWQGTVLN